MGVSVLQIERIKKISFGITLFIVLTLIAAVAAVYAADTPGIDDDTVITAEQAGSLAPSEGDYGWDSRGAVFRYYSRSGKTAGSLGEVMFRDRSGKRRPFLWDEWGTEFPDWWGKQLAERIRSEAGDDKIPAIREAFAEYVTFECEWMIAIGTKSSTAGNRLYKTLRNDGTLRVMNTADLDDGTPAEVLFAGNDMAGSLSSILKGESWGEKSLNTFTARNPYYYDVRIRSFDVDIRATNCTVCAAKGCKSGSTECTHVPKGTFINLPVPIIYEGVPYSGAKSFVWEGQTVIFHDPVIEGYARKNSGDDISGLNGRMSGNAVTPTGNTRIFLYYETLVPKEKLNDLAIKYVVLKESGNSVKETVKDVLIKDGITQGSEFRIDLDNRISASGKTYELIPGIGTGLSYAANPKFANAVKGINAYMITASEVNAGRITYATGTAYNEDRPGLLYVPVRESAGPVTGNDTENDPVNGNNPAGDDSGENTPAQNGGNTANPGTGYTGSGLVRRSEDPAVVMEILSDTFDVSSAIPSTENVYIRAEFADYLYALEAAVISGRYPIRVTVDLPYELRWTETDDEGNTEDRSESGSNTVSVSVYRDYSFIRLNSFAYYVPESITLENRALDPQSVTITAAQAGIRTPSCMQPVGYGGSRLGGNIDLPSGCPAFLTASVITVDGGEERPSAPSADTALAQSLAEAAVGRMRCRNDELVFGGNSILGPSGWHNYAGTASADTSALSPGRSVIDSGNVLGRDHISIPAQIRNGVYPATARLIRYRPEISYGGASIAYNPVAAVNAVRVHTPVICELQISECDPEVSNLRFDQEPQMSDTDAFQIVIGDSVSYGMGGHENDSCDFWLFVNNAGQHPVYAGKLGSSYDYAVNRSGLNGGSYVLTNEVYFPFDVYMDVGNDRNMSNDRLLTGGSWYVLSGRQRYYLPDTTSEGDYCIESRTRAVNSRSRTDMVSRSVKNGLRYLYANSDPGDYVTADSVRVHVSGKMYGFRLTGVDSDAEWKNVFEDRGSTKLGKPGIKDGTQTGVLPDGKVKSQGLKDYCFYYSAGMKNELGLSAGRHPKFILPMLAGCSPDASKQNSGLLKAGYVWNFQLITSGRQMAADGAYLVIEPRFAWIDDKGMYHEDAKVYYSETEDGILKRDKEFGQKLKVTIPQEIKAGSTLRLWGFDYCVPSNYSVRLGSQLCRSGYLAVNFKITAYNAAGKELMGYNAAEAGGVCNMWALEDQQLRRRDFYGRDFDLRYGDIVLLDVSESKGDDFAIDHKY
ncbi:MAG: hypothetical protein II694_09790 [Lachnospiraceae bacterium]|nr:hypothetical protein [Lachnospiraceae bacterium]